MNFLNSFLDKNFSWSHVQTLSHNAHWKALGKVHLEVSKRIGCCPRTSADEQTPTGRYKHTVSRAVRCAPRAHGRQKHWRTRRKVARNTHIYRSARVHLQARLKRTDKLTDTYLFVVFSSSRTLLMCSKIRACSKTLVCMFTKSSDASIGRRFTWRPAGGERMRAARPTRTSVIELTP